MIHKILLSTLVVVNVGCTVNEPIVSSPNPSVLQIEKNSKHQSATYLLAESARMKAKNKRITADLNNTEQGNVKEVSVIKHVQIKVVELQSSQGLKYVGGEISAANVDVYLTQLEHILGDDFSAFRENQAIRDNYTFHMTLVNPYEFQTLTKAINYGDVFSVTLFGLGKVVKTVEEINKKITDNEQTKVNKMQSTYFVVAESNEAQYFRQQLLLKPKDFHVTLGFSPKDIYGVRKNKDTLLYQFPEFITPNPRFPSKYIDKE